MINIINLSPDRNINGMAFKYIPEADWEKFGLSYGGLVILKEFILKQVYWAVRRLNVSNGRCEVLTRSQIFNLLQAFWCIYLQAQ